MLNCIYFRIFCLLLFLHLTNSEYYKKEEKCKLSKDCKISDPSSLCHNQTCVCRDPPYKLQNNILICPSRVGDKCHSNEHLTRNAICQNKTVVCKKGSIPTSKWARTCADEKVPLHKHCIANSQCIKTDSNSICNKNLVTKSICDCPSGITKVNGKDYCNLVQLSSSCVVSETCGTYGKCIKNQCSCNQGREFNFGPKGFGGCQEPLIYLRPSCFYLSNECDQYEATCVESHCKCDDYQRFSSNKNQSEVYCVTGTYLNRKCFTDKDCNTTNAFCSHQGCYCKKNTFAKLFGSHYECVKQISEAGVDCDKYDKINVDNAKCVDGIVKCDSGYKKEDGICFKDNSKKAIIITVSIIGGAIALVGLAFLSYSCYSKRKFRA